MEQFNLEEWLKNKSRKIVTRDGRAVRIVYWDAENSKPIVALVSTRSIAQRQFEELTINYFNDGTYYGGAKEDSLDLFFADKEYEPSMIIQELKSYLKNAPKEQVEEDWKEIQDWYACQFKNEMYNEEELTEFEKEVAEAYEWAKSTKRREDFVNKFAPKLLDLARKEIEKENPEFKPKFTYNEKDYSELANKLIEFRNNTPLCSVSYRDGEGRKIILHYEKEILDLARKQLQPEIDKEIDKAYRNQDNVVYKKGREDALKSLPKWKKCVGSTGPFLDYNSKGEEYLYLNDYVIKVSELFEKLPKE